MIEQHQAAQALPLTPPMPTVTAMFARIVEGRATAADYDQYMSLWEQRAAANAAARRKAA